MKKLRLRIANNVDTSVTFSASIRGGYADMKMRVPLKATVTMFALP